MPSQGPNEGAYAGISTGPEPVPETNANTNTSAIAARGDMPVSTVQVMGGPESVQPKNIHNHPAASTAITQENNSVNVVNILVPTPIAVSKLELSLAGHPDQNFVAQLCNNLRCGAHIGFEGERKPRYSKNVPTAFAHPDIISSNLAHEISLGRVAGPFNNPPFANFQVSPIGLVPKKHSAKFRTIFHLSFPKSGSTSINASISKDDFSLQYVTIDNAIEGIKRLGQGCFLAKTDIESAFRLIPVHPDDYELLGMCWNGKYYYDKVLPFGLRSAPYIFNQLSEAIEWILKNKCRISFVCHILDDFLIMEPASPGVLQEIACHTSLNAMLLTFKNLNIHIAPGKTEGPRTVLEFMGIILDTIRMEARLPADKIERLRTAFELFQKRRSCTLKELQSLIGTLNFACKVIPPGRPYLQRMIELTRNVKQPHHHIKLSAGFFKDLEMWKQFIINWNGASFFLSSEWTNSECLELHTDASGTLGYGGIFGAKWFQGKWEPHQHLGEREISIAWQELFAIVVACHIWGGLLKNKRIILHCDNESVVNIINSKRSRVSRVMDLLRHLTLMTLQYNIYIRAKHIPGKHNEMADSLSRFQFQRFRMLAPQADVVPHKIPDILLHI